MPRTTIRKTSHLPALLLASAGLVLGGTLVHDVVDRRVLTPDSIFHSPLATALSILGVVMAGVLLWDSFPPRRSR